MELNRKTTAKLLNYEWGAEEGLRDWRGDRSRPLRRRPPLHGALHRRGLRRQVGRPVAARRRPRPGARGARAQAGPARRRGQPGRGAGARGVRGRVVDPHGDGPLLRSGPARLGPPPPRRARAGARRRRRRCADRRGARALPPLRGGPPRRQARQRPPRRRGGRRPARAPRGLRVGRVCRRRRGPRRGTRGDAPLRGTRGGGRRGVRREGGRVERRGGDVRAALRRRAPLRGRHGRGGACGRAAGQRKVPAEAVRRRVAGRQGPHEADDVPRLLETPLCRASPRSPVDRERRRSPSDGAANLNGRVQQSRSRILNHAVHAVYRRRDTVRYTEDVYTFLYKASMRQTGDCTEQFAADSIAGRF